MPLTSTMRVGGRCEARAANVRPSWYAYAIQPIERVNMSKSVKMVEFSLTKPKSEVPFTTLNVSLKKFKVLRSDFEDLSLRVEVLDFYKK